VTTTDEHGDFAIVYHARDVEVVREASPELYVMVEDAAGNTLHSTWDRVTSSRNRVDHREIVMPRDKAPEPERPARPPRSTQTRRTASS
jgi:hypothetical protein